LLVFVVCVLTTLASGCGSHATRRGPVDARTSIFPARPGGTLTPSDLAFGGGPWIRAPRSSYGISDAELAAYLKPEARAAAARTRAREHSPSTPAKRTPALPAPPAVAYAREPAPRTEQSLALVARTAPAADATRYAEREQRSQRLAEYRGGDAIVITTTTLLIIVLIVLLLILIT
jgi:hypothetical protein